MAFVITQGCCNDGSCVPVCPVQCIRPRPGDPEFSHTEQLYIDPTTCIDCGACMDECPVSAVHPDWEIPENLLEFADINAEYFQTHPLVGVGVPSFSRRTLPPTHPGLRVAVVGSGPAGCYATEALSEITGVTVSLFDRLPTPFGLIRTGVAPDHPETKNITERFSKALQRRNVECFFNVEVGKDISLDELLQHHHAVIWAGGANSDRQLGISGEALPGCYSARDFVSWYNGHPGQADHAFELDPDRVVLIGNGNVALDVARILMLSEQVLGTTDMSDAAAQTISRAGVREVLVAARRGPEEAAYSLGELMALEKIEGVTLVVEPGEVGAGSDDDRRHEVIRRAAGRVEPYAEDRIIRLRYGVEPIRINGSDRVESITFRASDGHEDTIRTGTVFRAIGYRGVPVDGLPFDPTSGILPNDGGRVVSPESDLAVTGMYCAGWIKRGPRGVIGTNKPDAEETVDCILNDLVSDRLRSPIGTADTLSALLAQRGVELVDKAGWSRIDSTEKQLGLAEGRPRRKLVRSIELVQAARGVG